MASSKPKVGGSVADKDKGLKAAIERYGKAAFGATLQVGINEAEGDQTHEGSDLTIAEIGEVHEFGLGVPRRSFIADWSDEREEEHRAQIRKIARAVCSGKLPSWEMGLARLGVLYVAEIQKRISDGIEPPLAQVTIDRKGSSTPLIDHGILRSSITFTIEK
jgi:hypothetical protein